MSINNKCVYDDKHHLSDNFLSLFITNLSSFFYKFFTYDMKELMINNECYLYKNKTNEKLKHIKSNKECDIEIIPNN